MSMLSGIIKTEEVASETEMIPWANIRTDGGTQMRVGMSQATIDEYTEAMRNGDQFPPIVVFVDENGVYWLADGFHRYQAQRQAFGTTHVSTCILKPGSKRHAILYAAQANAKHGLARTPEDKRRSVDTLLVDLEWCAWSDRQIARACAVSNTFVASRRAILTVNVDSENDEEQPVTGRTYTNRHGTTSTMKTSNITAANHDRKRPAPAAPFAATIGKAAAVAASGSVAHLSAVPAAPSAPTLRPLTADESAAVIWRAVRVDAGALSDARLLDWLGDRCAPADYQHLLASGVMFEELAFGEAWNAVRREVFNRHERAQRKAVAATEPPAPQPARYSAEFLDGMADVVRGMASELGDVYTFSIAFSAGEFHLGASTNGKQPKFAKGKAATLSAAWAELKTKLGG